MRSGYVASYDRWMLAATVSLVGLGLLMIYSSTSVVTPMMEQKKIQEFYYFKKHIFTVVLGFLALFAAYRMDKNKLRDLSVPLIIGSFVLLLLVFVPKLGVTAGGARRWIRLWPSTFQPSELCKLAMVFFLAWFASRKVHEEDLSGFWGFAIPVAVMLAFQAVFLKQPDFGATMSLGVLTMGMLFVAGAKKRYLLYLFLAASPAIWYLVHAPYRLKRLTSFLDPWKYKSEGGFQLVQSFIALGSGGLGGVGLGKSVQKLGYLPEVHTDFIFSMVGEELGFLAAAFVVAAFGFLFLRGIAIAGRQKDRFAYYLCYGLSLLIAMQAFVNFCVVTGMLPTKGLPLPFISYGGSALIVNMTAIGLLLNHSRQELDAETLAPASGIEALLRMKKAKRSVYGMRA